MEKERMKTTAIIVGHNQWEEYTFPFIKSLKLHNPELDVVVVNNGSLPIYPLGMPGLFDTIGLSDLSCYAKAINFGISFAKDVFDPDWYIILNNDMYCHGPFMKILENLKDDTIYGDTKRPNFGGYIEGHLIIIPRHLLAVVGYFDEQFEVASFEDIDYSYRARQNGFKVEAIEFPIEHFHGKTRFDVVDDYNKTRARNKQRFLEKHGL